MNWAESSQARFAVNMLLLRGDSQHYHSRILWWGNEGVIGNAPLDSLYGGEWGWTPGNDGCSSYPASHFVRLGVDTSGMDPFCSGHAMLGDGKVLIAGGQNAFIAQYGENRARIYTAGTDSRGTWSPTAHPMNFWRYYPTVTTLRDGRAIVTSGSHYRQHRTFGGRINGAAPASPSGDTLRRFAPIPNGRWDKPLYPDTNSTDRRPSPRYAHSAVRMEYVKNFWTQVYFGGIDTTNAPQNDTWFQSIDNNALGDDRKYRWTKPVITGGSPAKRSDHTAIVALDTNMVVFGGLDNTNNGRSDVWRFFYDPSPPATYRWNQITPDSAGPAVYGHTAIYDATVDSATATLRRRMIVFGGTSALDQNPTDATVWELRFSPTDANSATWYQMPQIDLGYGRPSPRYWHTMNADPTERDRTLATDNCHAAIMFGGKLTATTCSDTLWKLWILRNGNVGWESLAPPGDTTLPGARARHSTVLDLEQSGYVGRIYVHGGINRLGGPADSYMYVLDPWGGRYPSWTRWTDLGISLAGQTSLLDSDAQSARTAEIYDPGTNDWVQTSASLWQQFYPPVFLVPGGGGNSRLITVGNNTQQTYLLDLPGTGQGSWTEITGCSINRLVQAAVQYRPGRIMVAGGTDISRVATGATKTLNTSSLSTGWVPGDTMIARRDPNLC